MSELGDKFASYKVRESSGSATANRYAYQRSWAIATLLTLHLEEDDYAIVLEHHDDVVVFNSSTKPSAARVYQVKTRAPSSSNWTGKALTKPDQSGHSIFSKLFSSRATFKQGVTGLGFVSNKPLRAKLSDTSWSDTNDRVTFRELHRDEKALLHKAAEGDDCTLCDWEGLNCFLYIRSNLSLDGHETHVTGLLAEFLESNYGADAAHGVMAAYRAIADEVSRKSQREGQYKTWSAIVEERGITKHEFTGMLSAIAKSQVYSAEHNFEGIRAHLLSEHFTPREIRELHNCWIAYRAVMLDSGSQESESLREVARQWVAHQYSIQPDTTVRELLSTSKEMLETGDLSRIETPAIQGAILFEAVYGEELQEIGEEPKEAER